MTAGAVPVSGQREYFRNTFFFNFAVKRKLLLKKEKKRKKERKPIKKRFQLLPKIS